MVTDNDNARGATPWTPGPWAVSKQKARRVTAGGVIICNAVLRNQGGPKTKCNLKEGHEAEANARLIAAAPALYEALAGLVAAPQGLVALSLARGEQA